MKLLEQVCCYFLHPHVLPRKMLSVFFVVALDLFHGLVKYRRATTSELATNVNTNVNANANALAINKTFERIFEQIFRTV